MTSKIQPNPTQPNPTHTTQHNKARARLMQTLDSVHERYERGTLKLASVGMQTQHRQGHYET